METRKVKSRWAAMLVLCGILACALIAVGGDLEPSAPPGPTMKTLDEVEPRIPIPASAIPTGYYQITQSGSYYLTGDRYAVVTGIIVAADNVTIDLMGYQLIGPDGGTGNGIEMQNCQNVEIRNGTVRDFGRWGVYDGYATSSGHRVIGVRAVSNGYSGIEMKGVDALVEDCRAAENGHNGIAVGHSSTVTGNNVYNNGWAGIHAQSACTVTGNSAQGNQNHGIMTSHGCTVTGNNASRNVGSGINASASTVVANTAFYNGAYGIALGGNCLVDQNCAHSNDQGGSGAANISSCSSCTFGTNHAPLAP
jgi:parallel beta-helix repeat protein